MKHLILMIILLVSVAAHGAPWLCGNTDVVYDSQNFCTAVCSETCIEMTPNGGTCNGGYKNYAFDRSKNKTYALSVNKQKWIAASNQLAIIRDVRTNDILKDILIFSGESEAWIGLYDPNMSQSFNNTNDTRFKWRDNTVLNYRNWAEGQPDNKLNASDIGKTDIYGEHYGVINATGFWSDSGGNVMMNALIEFSGVQPCVSGTVPSELVTPDDMQSAFCDGSSSNCYLCTDNTDIFQCTQGTGGFLCPKNQQNCNMNYTNASCPAGTTLNPTTDKCEATVITSCPTGYTFNSSLNKCQANPVCPAGSSYNTSAKKCVISPTIGSCPSGYTEKNGQCSRTIISEPVPQWDTCSGHKYSINDWSGEKSRTTYCRNISPGDTCYSMGNFSASCVLTIIGTEGGIVLPGKVGGVYQGNGITSFHNTSIPTYYCTEGVLENEKCVFNEILPKPISCASGYTFDSALGMCVRTPTCNNGGVFNSSTNKCELAFSSTCPTGTTQNSNICQADPSCSTGSYSATQNKCFTTSCPINGKPCVNVGGVYKCSAYDCYNSTDTGNYQSEDTTEGGNDKKADGEFDEAGQCLGTIYIFNGNDRRCRPSGVQTGGTDCCKKKDDWFGLSKCNPNEQTLSSLRNWGKKDGQCVDIGSYCSEKWLGICVQRKKTYCCFGTSLARIIAEQGRAQLGIGWGSAKKPECRGFTPEEFQKIDFDKIDFSEWMEHEVNANMKGNMEANIQNAFENISIPGVQ